MVSVEESSLLRVVFSWAGVLECMREQTEQARSSKAGSTIAPWSLFHSVLPALALALASLNNGLLMQVKELHFPQLLLIVFYHSNRN